jgi:hypothetical protein
MVMKRGKRRLQTKLALIPVRRSISVSFSQSRH